MVYVSGNGAFRDVLFMGFLAVGYCIMLFYCFGIKGVFFDPLNRNFITLPYLNWRYSFWPVTHFIFHALLAYHYPQFVFIFLLVGVLWEIIEFSASRMIRFFIDHYPDHKFSRKYHNFQHKLKYLKNKVGGKFANIQYRIDAMGSFSDIIFNTFGLLLGYYLSRGELLT